MRVKLEGNVKEKICVRFAPSPTGYLHIGGVRTALYNYLFARKNNGEFLLRIEDTDQERSTRESLDQILKAMKWLGLEWDGELTYQSQRLDIYRSLAEELVAQGKAYYCDCTKEELGARKKELESKGVFVGYDGRCRERGLKKGDSPHMVIRLKVDNGQDLSYTDLIRGEINFDSKEIDDFILIRSDGFPTYNFAVVVDDHAMGITHVLRGDDHIINTPKQIAIYRALGYETPGFGHFSMILGSDKSRLSKRHGATSVSEYRQNGYLPSALLNYLAKLGWGHGDKELYTKEELIDAFSLEGVNKAPAVFSPDKLLWVNQEHIKMLSYDAIAPYLKPFLEEKGIDPGSRTEEWFRHALDTLRGRVKTLEEMAEKLLFYFSPPKEWAEKDVAKAMKKSSPELLHDYAAALEKLSDFSVEALEKHMKEYCEDRSINMGGLAQPLRLAVTGTTVSPGIHDVLCLMGKEETLARVRAFMAQL
ncbi:MAG TPA: glutamate--tRNA ligase [Firmicutes bacterium]|nr:glutamate--tRNA ligase [Bacillota bacterium]